MDFNVLFSTCSQLVKLDDLLREDVGHLLGESVRPSSRVCNHVEVPGLLRLKRNVAPMTWLGIPGDIGNVLIVVDAQLLVARFVQLGVVEHAHEDCPAATNP